MGGEAPGSARPVGPSVPLSEAWGMGGEQAHQRLEIVE